TASCNGRTPGLVALALVGCLSQSLAARMQDNSHREGRGGPEPSRAVGDEKSALTAAAKKLAEAPSYRWTTTVTAGDLGPFGGGGVTAGQTERGGFTRVAMPSGVGRLEFVTRAGKAAVMLEGNWQTPEQAVARGGVPTPFGPPAAFERAIVSG